MLRSNLVGAVLLLVFLLGTGEMREALAFLSQQRHVAWLLLVCDPRCGATPCARISLRKLRRFRCAGLSGC
jgi:hypothetical protein